MKMLKRKVGEEVILAVSSKYNTLISKYPEHAANPIGTRGVIKSVSHHPYSGYHVAWDNGKWNVGYKDADLKSWRPTECKK